MANFIYCLNSSTIRPAPILKKIEIAAKAGYKAIELWQRVLDIRGEDAQPLQALAELCTRRDRVYCYFDWDSSRRRGLIG